jgi:hypothetical protein
LSVTRDVVGYPLKLPAFSTEKTEINPDLELAIGDRITAQYQSNYPMVVLENAEAVRVAKPDFQEILQHAPWRILSHYRGRRRRRFRFAILCSRNWNRRGPRYRFSTLPTHPILACSA